MKMIFRFHCATGEHYIFRNTETSINIGYVKL